MSGGAVLITSPRHTAKDLETWALLSEIDDVEAQRTDWPRLTAIALDEMEMFARRAPCYAGVSWGKDSVVVAHLAWRLREERGVTIPLVAVRTQPIENPDCPAVRDAFLERFPMPLTEVEVWCTPHHDVEHETKGVAHEWGWTAKGTLEAGFAEACRRTGADRHISGVRAAESGPRKLRMMRWGISTENTCAPIGWWKTPRVFAYLARFDLPIHPAYACSRGGLWERDRLRVSALGRTRGQGIGRLEWERTYYGAEMRAWERLAKARLA